MLRRVEIFIAHLNVVTDYMLTFNVVFFNIMYI